MWHLEANEPMKQNDDKTQSLVFTSKQSKLIRSTRRKKMHWTIKKFNELWKKNVFTCLLTEICRLCLQRVGSDFFLCLAYISNSGILRRYWQFMFSSHIFLLLFLPNQFQLFFTYSALLSVLRVCKFDRCMSRLCNTSIPLTPSLFLALSIYCTFVAFRTHAFTCLYFALTTFAHVIINCHSDRQIFKRAAYIYDNCFFFHKT